MKRIDNWREDIVQFYLDVTNGHTPNAQMTQLLLDLMNNKKHRYLVSCGRGTGKTKLIAVFCAWKVVVRSRPVHIAVIAGSHAQSERLLQYIREFMLSLPELAKGCLDRRWTPAKNRLVWKDTSFVESLSGASEKSLRSCHAQVVIYDEAALIKETYKNIASGIKTPVDGQWTEIYISTPSPSSATWFDRLLKKRPKDVLFYNWSIDDCHWMTKDFIKTRKKELHGLPSYGPEIDGVLTIHHFDSTKTFSGVLSSDNVFSSMTYRGGPITISIDPNFTGKSSAASRSGACIIEKINNQFFVHAVWDFSSCKTVQEQVDFILALAKNPLGLEGIHASEVIIDNGASILFSTLSKYANIRGLSFKNRSKMESRAVQFLPRCYFNGASEDTHLSKRVPKTPYRNIDQLMYELRNYSPAWIKSNRHDFADSLLLGLYEEYKPQLTAVYSQHDPMAVLRECSEGTGKSPKFSTIGQLKGTAQQVNARRVTKNGWIYIDLGGELIPYKKIEKVRKDGENSSG